jgi:hypothetical protein
MLNRPFMSLNVIFRTEILDVDLFMLLLFILIKEDYSRITAEYLYGLTVKIDNIKTFNKMSHLSCMCTKFIACKNFSFLGRRSRYSLLTASLGYIPQ